MELSNSEVLFISHILVKLLKLKQKKMILLMKLLSQNEGDP